MTAVAGDVPGKFDVIVDGTGYIFDRVQGDSSSSLALRSQRGDLGYTPTFLPRTNISGNYGDDNQDFWLTASQNNWVRGEQQRFFRSTDTSSVEQFWDSQGIEIRTPGEVTLGPALVTFANSDFPAVMGGQYINSINGYLFTGNGASTTRYDYSGATISYGSSASGATLPTSLVSDGSTDGVYVATTNRNIRKWVSGTTWTDFSTSDSNIIAYHNNSLYGLRAGALASNANTTELVKYDASGVASSVFVWLGINGSQRGAVATQGGLLSFGGKLMILFNALSGDGSSGTSLWQYDGTNTNIVEQFPSNFVGVQLAVLEGILYVGGYLYRRASTTSKNLIYSYDGNSTTIVWKANDYQSTNNGGQGCGVTTYDDLLVFTDGQSGTIKGYDPVVGSIFSLTPYLFTDSTPQIYSGGYFVMPLSRYNNTSTKALYPASVTSSSGYLSTSLFDFDSSLTKVLRGVKVDWEPGSDGDGGSVDISYQLNSLAGSYTSLQTGVTSGTEYPFSMNTTCRSVSIRVTLNKGTSTKGPKLKRIYVRAVPLLQQFRRATYHIDCTGKDGNNNVVLNNGQSCPMDGQQLLDAFITSAKKTTLLSITDNISTYNGIIELDTISVIPTRPSEYIVQFSAREV